MKRKMFVLLVTASVMLVIVVIPAMAGGKSDLAAVRAATARFHRAEIAQAAGWDLQSGLDHCFNNPGVGAMGYHYINPDLLDLTVQADQPEAMVYAPGSQGQLHLGAVEYIVPAEPWDNAGNTAPPTLLGQTFHLNKDLGVYVLHAWIWKHNPAGIFEDWNPRVSCP